MRNLRALALLFALALLPACGSSILAPEPDVLLEEVPLCDPDEPTPGCRGYIGSGS